MAGFKRLDLTAKGVTVRKFRKLKRKARQIITY